MVDTDTFVTVLYVRVDDFCKACLPPEPQHPGPDPSLSRSEVVTLSVMGQWAEFKSERGFYRYARRHFRSAFPTLPDRGQFNRLQRAYRDAITAFALYLADQLGAAAAAYQVMDSTAAVVRDFRRRSRGWLVGEANIGYSNRLGWYNGFRVLSAVTREGVITGFGFGSASVNDRRLADTLLAVRRQPEPRLPSVGRTTSAPYLADKGFAGEKWEAHWWMNYGARVICQPEKRTRRAWPKKLCRWFAGLRQIVETVHDKLLNTFRLDRERPHDLAGFQARLAAKVGLHNFCMWLNKNLDRPLLAFAELIDW